MRTAFALGSALLLAGSCLLAAEEGSEDLSARLQRYRQGLAPAAAKGDGRTLRPVGDAKPAQSIPEPAAPRELAQPGRLAPVPANEPLRVAARPGLATEAAAEPAAMAPEALEPVAADDTAPLPMASPNVRATTSGPRRVSVLRKEDAAPNAPARVAELPAELQGTAKAATPFSVGSAPSEPDQLEAPESARRTAALPKPGQTISPRSPVAAKPKTGPEALFAHRGPALSVETIGPKQLSVGKPASYVLKLANTGGSAAEEVVVFAAVPDSVTIAELRATSGTARIEAIEQGVARLKWTLDRLAPQGEEQLVLSLVAKGGGAVTLEAGWTCRPALVQASLAVVEPRLAVAVSGPRELNYGDTKVYTVTLSNPGTGDAENVTVQLVPTSPAQPSAESNRIGVIKAGEQKQLELELTAREAGPLAIRVNATGEGGLQATAEEQVVVRRARLNIVAQSPPLAFAGTVAEYVIKVQNLGDASVDKITAVAVLPPGAKYQANLPGATFDAPRGKLSWNVGTLPPSTEKSITISCQLTQAGTNRVDIQAAAGDLTASGAAATEVESLADLKLTVDDPAGPVAVGAETSYTIRLVNRGTKAAEQIAVRAIFSEGVEAVTVSGGKADIAHNTAAFQAIPKIAPGQEIVLTVTARASIGGNHVFRAEVDCRDPETKLVSQQTTRFYGGTAPAAAPRATTADPRFGLPPTR